MLPSKFLYSKGDRILLVTWVDLSITRYLDVDPRLIFLQNSTHQNKDFLQWLENFKPAFKTLRPAQRTVGASDEDD